MAWCSVVERGGEVVPIRGWPAGLKFDGRVVFVWWGQDADEHDCAAARSGQLRTFASEAECWAIANARGWPSDAEPTDDDAAVVTDLGPAQEWLRGKRVALDPQAGLNLWNWADDAAYSTGRIWNDGGGVRDRCYDKLFAAAVPWVYGMESYKPTWTPRQVRALREVLGQAVHVLRAAIGD